MARRTLGAVGMTAGWLLGACADEATETRLLTTPSSSASGGTTATGGAAGASAGGGGAGQGGGPGAAGGAGGAAGAASAYECPATLDPCPAFPAESWATASPAEVGLDATALDEFVAATGDQQGVVTRYGYLVRSWGSESAEIGWASASKAVWSTFLLFAVQEGRLAGPDDLVAEQGWALRAADQPMTYRQLANQTSGYGLNEAPGEAWAYNDYAIKLYALTLFERLFTDGTADQVSAHPDRFGSLGFQDGDLFALQNGAPRVSTSPRDFARIGWLWANHGRWGERQLLPASALRDGWQPGVPADLPRTAGGSVDDYLGLGTAGGGADQSALGPGVYGFNFWLNPDQQLWPAAPPDTIQANGHWNGEVVTVMPSLALVAAWRGASGDPDSFNQPMNALLAALVAAVAP